jgi:phage regulator Rha-like protein
MPTSRKPTVPAVSIERQIHAIRGHRVVLGSDIAGLYGVTVSALNQAVRRNIERFPGDFMFALTKEEADNLTSHSVISSWGGSRRLPFAFTEHGVSMLSAVLRSEQAVQVSIAIIRSFVAMREQAAANKNIALRVDKLERGHKRVASVIEILVEDIDRVARDVGKLKALPLPRERKIGFDM